MMMGQQGPTPGGMMGNPMQPPAQPDHAAAMQMPPSAAGPMMRGKEIIFDFTF